jgi:hypothetical protein
MATTVKNKTPRPLRIPLPGGRTLHLGPGKTGQISAKDAEHGAIQKLIAEAAIEIDDAVAHDVQTATGSRSRSSADRHARGSASRRSGDR